MDVLLKKAMDLGYLGQGIVTPAQKAYSQKSHSTKEAVGWERVETKGVAPGSPQSTEIASTAQRNDGILILSTKIAGTSYVKNLSEVTADVFPGTLLVLLREPDNKHDPRAVAVTDVMGRRIGYLPAKANQSASALLDAGKDLYAVVTMIEERSRSAEILIDIYLKDA